MLELFPEGVATDHPQTSILRYIWFVDKQQLLKCFIYCDKSGLLVGEAMEASPTKRPIHHNCESTYRADNFKYKYKYKYKYKCKCKYKYK